MAATALVLGFIVVLGIATPRLLLRLIPQRRRSLLLLSGRSWLLPALLSLLVLGVAYEAGYALGDPAGPSRSLGGLMILLCGLPASAAICHAWEVSRQAQRMARAAPGPPLPSLADGLRAAGHRQSLSEDPAYPVARERYVVDRGLRRARAAAWALIAVLYPLAKLRQVLGFEISGFAGVAFVGSLLVAFLIPVILRLRKRRARSTATAPLPAGAIVTVNDTDRLLARFPQAPLLRTGRKHDRLFNRYVVDGMTHGWYWWVAVQSGQLYDANGLRRSRRLTTVLVWLPGLELPTLVVRGRDNTSVHEWLGSSLTLESWSFNEQLHVQSAPDQQSYAVSLMHPRAMQLLVSGLPDGGTVIVDRDLVSVVLDREARLDEVAALSDFAVRFAGLVPTHVLKDHALHSSGPVGPGPS